MLIIEKAQPDLLIESIYKNIEDEAEKEKPRGYIGASSIGDECELKLWLTYKKPELKKKRKAELIMAANDGYRSEDLVAGLIRQSPYNIELITHDKNGKQLGFSDLDGNYKGHWDGLITGIPQAPKTQHIWEHKAKNQKFYDTLTKLKEKVSEKSLLEEWDYNYYCQAVTYMHYSATTRHYTTVALAGTGKLQSIRTNENPSLAKHLRNKAERITKYISPPAGISTNPSFYKCKWCDFYENCPSINKNITM
jgi:hypothetical protein